MKQENLPYRIFDSAASLFAGEQSGFSHHDMTNFFCHELNKHPKDVEVPNGINRKDKFKWWLGQFSIGDQRLVLDSLCRRKSGASLQYRWPSDEDRQQLLQMLGSSPVAMPPTRIDTTAVYDGWRKAQERIPNDAEGAITAARTLLESVCKHILDELGVEYADNADLPKLYGLASKELNLAPSQHTEEAFRKILSGAHSVVDGLANLRNRIGDAHGHGKRSVTPLPRHAELAVNMAGSMASFLLATFDAKGIPEGRLQLGKPLGSVPMLGTTECMVTCISVKNAEGRFENSMHNVKAELRFFRVHNGEELIVQGRFVETDRQRLTIPPRASVSLGMLESANLGLLVRVDGTRRRFCTFTTWPFDPTKESNLPFGEWRLGISVTSDVRTGRANADYTLQLNPDLSAGWSPLGKP